MSQKHNIVALSTAEIIPLCEDVWIDAHACAAAVEGFVDTGYDVAQWSKHELNPLVKCSKECCKTCSTDCSSDQCERSNDSNSSGDFPVGSPAEFQLKNMTSSAALDWIFTVDLLNFSFWSDVDNNDTGSPESQRYAVEYNGKLYTGYWALCAAINKALARGIAITTPSTWLQPGFESLLKEVLASATKEQVPLFEERLRVMQEASKMNLTNNTSIHDLLREADRSALKLVDLVTSTYPSFDDQSIYKAHTVYINKRAQILVADIWGCFQGSVVGEFIDIDELTMFADYRVPQILYTLGCLKYSDRLKNKIMSRQYIEHGDPEEVEIRACSIQAVEVMLTELRKSRGDSGNNSSVNAILLDFYLWDTAKQKQKQLSIEMLCHRTRSVYY